MYLLSSIHNCEIVFALSKRFIIYCFLGDYLIRTASAYMHIKCICIQKYMYIKIKNNYITYLRVMFLYLGYRCPLCDSSIYPYCSEKLLHDACCCTNSHDLPYQCKVADCRFLHANSCREHRLIANCCCNDDYRAVLKSLGQA